MKNFLKLEESNHIRLLDAILYTKDGSVWYDRGYLDGEVSAEFNIDPYVLKVGVPLLLVGQIPISFSAKTKVKAIELTPENVCWAQGIDESLIIEWDGLTEYTQWWKTTVAERHLLTFQKDPGSDFEFAMLTHKGLVLTGDVPVISDLEGTPYTAGTDYRFEPNRRLIIRKRGSTIPSLGSVYAKYKCIPPAGKQIPFKRNGFINWTGETLIVGTDVTSNQQIQIYHPKAEVSGGGFTTNEESAWGMDIEIEAVRNEASPTYPLGYILVDVNTNLS